MRNSWKVIGALLLCATTALADPDAFGLGTGRDGALSVTEPRTVINRYVQVTEPLAPGDAVLFVASTDGFAAGDLIMLLQTTGLVPEPPHGEPRPIDLARDPVGRWELARVKSAGKGELELTAPLVHSYAASVTQVIRVPEYTQVRVRSGASVSARAWDGVTGGVLAFLAQGTIHNDGELEASGAGFRGGLAAQGTFDAVGCSSLPRELRPGASRGEGISSLSYGPLETGLDNASNGGGSGICPMSGGGGGGNGGRGGQGGDSLAPWDTARDIGGRGGAALRYSLLDHLTLGGGGGKGHGAIEAGSRDGAGGGAIFIRGQRLSGTGSIAAEGSPGGEAITGGGGGGGAGGSIYLRLTESATCGSVSARGGAGGSAASGAMAYTATGGGGGGGRVLHSVSSGEACPLQVEAGPSAVARAEWKAQPGVIERGGGNTEATLLCTVAPVPQIKNIYFKSTNVTLEVLLTDNAVYDVRFYVNGSSSQNFMDLDANTGSWKPRGSLTLIEGTHSIFVIVRCSASDRAPGTLTDDIHVDLTVPNTSIRSGPPNPANDPSATFTFKALDETRGDVKFKCSMDGSAETQCASGPFANTFTYTYTNLTEGSHTFRVRAVDAAGNEDPTPDPFTWTVSLKPDTSIGTKPNNPTNQPSASFTFSGTLNPTGFECKLEPEGTQEAFAACTSPKSYTGLAPGRYTFSVRAMNASGLDPSPASHFWVIDTTAPETTLTNPPRDPSNNASPSFSFTATEPANFECNLDAGPYASCTSPKTYPGLTEGSHTVCVKARDPAGNQEPEAACHTWKVDTVPPNTTLSSTPPDPSNSATGEFSFTATETATFECKVDARAYESCTSPKAYPSLGEGSHTVCVQARDTAGNLEPEAACHTWKVDTVAPNTTLTIKPPDPDKSATTSFSFNATEAAVSFECKLDLEAYEGCTSPKTYPGLTDGSHTVCVRARDGAGNLEPEAACHTWTVDTVAPETTLTATPPNPSNSADGTFSFNATEASARFECKLDLGAYSGCTSPKTFPSLTEGSHTVCVRARDVAGNEEPSAECHTWKVDTRPPSTTIDSGPEDPTRERSAIFTFSASEDPVTFECKRDTEVNYAPCTSPKAYIGLAEGTHTFYVRARDSAGNVDPVGDTFEWQVDLTPPDTVIDNNPPNPTNSQSGTFTFRSTGGGARFDCKLDGGSFEPCGSGELGSITYSGLAPGPHTFQVRARDAAGNVDGSPSSYSWVVDLTAPVTQIRNKPSNPTNSTTAPFTFDTEALDLLRFECRLDGGTFEDCNGSAQYPNLAPGSHVFQVRAIDLAGNVESPAKEYRWLIDTSSPYTDFLATPPDPSKSQNADFVFFATGAVAFFCSLDGSAFEPCSGSVVQGQGSQQYSDLGEGSHVFLVRARNAAGTDEGTPARYEWIIDLTKPTTTIQSGPPRWTNIPKADFVVTSNEPRVTFECRLTGALEFTACPVPLSFVLPDGRYTLEVRAKDRAGNIAMPPATYDWEIDTKPPETVILAPFFGQEVGTPSPEIKGRTEPNSTVQVSIDGASPIGVPSDDAGDWVLSTSLALPNGEHKVEAYAIDRAGNRGAGAFAITFYVDTESPETSIKSAPSDPSRSAIALFVFESSDPNAKFECNINSDNNGRFDPCFATASFELPAGRHALRVRAKDEAGNEDKSPASYEWTIILEPPGPPEFIEPVNGSEVFSLVPTISGRTVSMGQVDVFLEALEGDVEQATVPAGCITASKAGLTDASAEGEWTFKPSTELKEGAYWLTARARNEAGTLGACASGIRFTVRAPRPMAHAEGGGLGCASSGPQPGMLLLAVVGAALWNRRRRQC